MSSLLEFIRFLYTGRSGAMDPLTALDVLFLTKGDEGSGGESALRFELNVSVRADLPCKYYIPSGVHRLMQHSTARQHECFLKICWIVSTRLREKIYVRSVVQVAHQELSI